MSTATFGFGNDLTAALWRSDVLSDGRPSTPYWGSHDTLFLLDRRTALPWFCLTAERAFDLAPAPYLGALSTVLSDLLTEEAP